MKYGKLKSVKNYVSKLVVSKRDGMWCGRNSAGWSGCVACNCLVESLISSHVLTTYAVGRIWPHVTISRHRLVRPPHAVNHSPAATDDEGV